MKLAINQVPEGAGQVVRVECAEHHRGNLNGWVIRHSDGVLLGGCHACGERNKPVDVDETVELVKKRVARPVDLGELIADSDPLTGTPYLDSKCIEPSRCWFIFQKGSKLIVPMTRGKAVVSAQIIDGRGQKKFLKGYSVKGCYWQNGSKPRLTTEGIADALTIANMGYSVRCVFSAHELSKARKGSIVVADHDEVGIRAAVDSGCQFVVPPEPGQDFNDLFQQDRRKARELIHNAIQNS